VNNFELPFIPERSTKPRNNGLTMMMDKGLSLRETEDMLSRSEDLIDIAKLGFGTSYVTKNWKRKSNYIKTQELSVTSVVLCLKHLLLETCLMTIEGYWISITWKCVKFLMDQLKFLMT